MEVGQLTVRVKSPGGPVADAVSPLPGISPQGRRQIVILIHGYNNPQNVASNSFDSCLRNLQDLPEAVVRALPSPVFKFYWPGDMANKILSTLAYPTDIAPANESGEKLAAFVDSLRGPGGGPVEVHIVCHSLGNRAGLRMLKALRGTAQIVRSATFMAAAVPVHSVEDVGDLMMAALEPRYTLALHSTSDRVLQWAFPSGETAAGDGFFPEAVGRFGHPLPLWTEQASMKPYGHSDYWPTPRTAAWLAHAMGAPILPGAPSNAIAEHDLPAAPAPAEPAITARTTPVHRLPR